MSAAPSTDRHRDSQTVNRWTKHDVLINRYWYQCLLCVCVCVCLTLSDGACLLTLTLVTRCGMCDVSWSTCHQHYDVWQTLWGVVCQNRMIFARVTWFYISPTAFSWSTVWYRGGQIQWVWSGFMTYGYWTFRKTLVAFIPPGGTNIWTGSWTRCTDQ